MADDRTVLETYREALAVKLTPTEELERSRRLAQLKGELESVEAEARRVVQGLRKKRQDIGEQMSALARVVRNGEESRAVTVYVVADFNHGVAEHLRADTLEVIPGKTRPLRIEEKQARLFGDAPPVASITVEPSECGEGKDGGS